MFLRIPQPRAGANERAPELQVNRYRPSRKRPLLQLTEEPPQWNLLSRPRHLAGPVIRGFGRGARKLGFPTANLDTRAPQVAEVLATLTPGVYAGYAAVLRPEGAPWPGENVTDWYRAAVNVGYVPSFDNRELSIEAHLLHEFSEDFYGAQMHLVLLAYLRPERKFVAIDALVAQIKHDIASTKRVLEELPFVPSACMFE
jgi:riboflavin kinase